MITIKVHGTFVAKHNYPEAPDAVRELRSLHSHLFIVTLELQLTKPREQEFILTERKLHACLDSYQGANLGPKSCEEIAQDIAAKFSKYNCYSVEVSEDGRYSARITTTDSKEGMASDVREVRVRRPRSSKH